MRGDDKFDQRHPRTSKLWMPIMANSLYLQLEGWLRWRPRREENEGFANCDEKFHPGHRCKTQRLFLIEGSWPEESETKWEQLGKRMIRKWNKKRCLRSPYMPPLELPHHRRREFKENLVPDSSSFWLTLGVLTILLTPQSLKEMGLRCFLAIIFRWWLRREIKYLVKESVKEFLSPSKDSLSKLIFTFCHLEAVTWCQVPTGYVHWAQSFGTSHSCGCVFQ